MGEEWEVKEKHRSQDSKGESESSSKDSQFEEKAKLVPIQVSGDGDSIQYYRKVI